MFMAWTLIPSNIPGRTKRTVASSLTFVGYCVGNMVGSQIFESKDAVRLSRLYTPPLPMKGKVIMLMGYVGLTYVGVQFKCTQPRYVKASSVCAASFGVQILLICRTCLLSPSPALLKCSSTIPRNKSQSGARSTSSAIIARTSS